MGVLALRTLRCLLIYADDPMNAGCIALRRSRVDDIIDKLHSHGLPVDSWDAAALNLPRGLLRGNYDAVLLWTADDTFCDRKRLGDELADYVDAGGGVVCMYVEPGTQPSGRWLREEYHPLEHVSITTGRHLGIGKIHRGQHPILSGVGDFRGGRQSWHNVGVLRPSARRIADWTDGVPFLAESRDTRVVFLNFYPCSSDLHPGYWDSSGDGTRLIANALCYAARRTHLI
ncbi:unnamed protein product [Vitrella brassicaformis CCMP3155]|uniref:ThuA-like domain-containing protein n=1 Tax=Vitrella brassicaformis (strain CCMP3155) TaxID=1169540 RepID=A0A0G4FRP6_VITBC|nr:unnamed protein product [Vitrella brassicaformis CCMP3155]|mmetsp:Transcript_35512/g.88272  ORF Transcript_35512/g.88272 Transcript_35512/m.88272 type:complete len:230 (-) Transcript_35512:2180-2869(-)|eukprot:CEM17323.1 unnamed protein product [Vitrella brassicaformis CCMP3155]